MCLKHTSTRILAGFISTDFLLALENIKKAARVVHIGCRDRKRAVKLVEDLGEQKNGLHVSFCLRFG